MSQILTQTDALVELRLCSQQITEDKSDEFHIKILNSDFTELVYKATGAASA